MKSRDGARTGDVAAAHFSSNDRFFSSYYDEITPASSTRANMFDTIVITPLAESFEEQKQPGLLSPTAQLTTTPPIPAKSPLRSRSANSTQSRQGSLPLPPTIPYSPISPISNPSHGHSNNSSCSSMGASFTVSRDSPYASPMSDHLKPYVFDIPNYSKPHTQNMSSTTKISSPTPLSPSSTQKRPKFLATSYLDDNYDYFSASLSLTPYAISYETLTSDGPPPRTSHSISQSSSRAASSFSLSNYDSRISFESLRYQNSGLREEFNAAEVCGVCRMARGEEACNCLWAGSDTGLDSDEDEEEVEGKKSSSGVRGWMKRTFARKARRATTGDSQSGKTFLGDSLRRKSE